MKSAISFFLWVISFCSLAEGIKTYSADELRQKMIPLTSEWFLWPGEYVNPDQAPLRAEGKAYTDHFEWKRNSDLADLQKATYYTRIQVDNSMDDLVLVIPTLASAAHVYINGELRYRQGTIFSDSEMEKPSRTYGYIDLKGLTDISIVIHNSSVAHRTGGMRGTIRLASFGIFNRNLIKTVTWLSFMVGSALLISCYHLVLFIFNRRSTLNLWFSIVCFCLAVRSSLAGNPRLMFEIWGTIPFETAFKIEYFTTVSAVLALAYYYNRIFPKLFIKRIATLSTFVLGPYLLCILLTDTSTYTNLLHYFQYYALGLIFTAIVVFALAIIKGEKRAVPFAVSVSFLLIGSIVDIAFSLKEQPINFSVYAIYLMMVAQSILIAYINDQTIKNLKFYKKMTSSAYDEIKKIVFPHQVQLLQKGIGLEETMPTGVAHGIVICFDVIKSSQLPEPIRKQLFLQTFSKSYQIMQEGYDANLMCSNAYRIKEVGDGFLCSIGFPFDTPPDSQSHENHALSLTSKFITVFDQCTRQLGINQTCAIGVAEGRLEGFYPKIGTKEYQLFGDGIVRADRFQEARKALNLDQNFHIVIFQESVFNKIDDEQKHNFTKIILEDQNYFIRDNIDEIAIYVRFYPLGFTASLKQDLGKPVLDETA